MLQFHEFSRLNDTKMSRKYISQLKNILFLLNLFGLDEETTKHKTGLDLAVSAWVPTPIEFGNFTNLAPINWLNFDH
jgi:hypothetical protein